MRFLADESCDFAVVRALRNVGHDVLAVSEISPRADDTRILDLSSRQERILVTEDKDLGQLVFPQGKNTRGVIFLRYPASARLNIAKEVVGLVKQRGGRNSSVALWSFSLAELELATRLKIRIRRYGDGDIDSRRSDSSLLRGEKQFASMMGPGLVS